MAETIPIWLADAGIIAASSAEPLMDALTVAGSFAGTALSLGSAGLSIIGGLSQSQAFDQRARMEELQAQQELIRGQQEANSIRENLLKTLAAQNAAYGAAGVDVGSGTPVDVQADTARQADRELDVSRSNALVRAAGRRMSASALRGDASSAMVGGFARGGISLLDYYSRQQAIS